MEAEGNNPNGMDQQSNVNNQLTPKALDREGEELMEECRSILNCDEPVSFPDMLTEGRRLSTPRDGNVDTEMLPRRSSELDTAPSHNNGGNRGKNLIIDLNDEPVEDDMDEMRQSYKRKSPEESSHGTVFGETSRLLERREVSPDDINLMHTQVNFTNLEQPQAENGAGNGIQVNEEAIPHMYRHPNPIRQGWTARNIRRVVLYSSVGPRNRQAQYNPPTLVPIWSDISVPPPMHPSEMPAPYGSVYYNPDAEVFYEQVDQPPAPRMLMGSTLNRPTHMNYQMFPGNMASSSRNPYALHGYRPFNVPRNHQLSYFDQYEEDQRLAQAASLQIEPWMPPHHEPVTAISFPGPSEIRAMIRDANEWPELSVSHLRHAGTPWNVDHNIMTVAHRTTLLNEIREAIRVLRGNIDLFRAAELVILEQSIGNVRTGLAEEVVDAHLRSEKFNYAAFGAPSEVPPCCICQDEYVEGDDTAKLPCQHFYHFDCIKLWLMEKNNCPICKHIAIDV